MTSARTYLDYNASAPLRPEARAAMLAALDRDGNPSSVHAEGRAVRGIVEAAREEVARLVNAKPSEVVFTSGATEANTWVLAAGWPAICVSGIEHDSVLAPARAAGAKLVELAGVAPTASSMCKRRLSTDAGQGRARSACMLANNETGVIQPVAEAAALGARARPCRACGRRAGAGTHRHRFRGARRRHAGAVGAQDRRPEGRRRARDPRRRIAAGAHLAAAARSAAGAAAPRTSPAIAGFGAAAAAIAARPRGRAAHGRACATALEEGVTRATPDAVIVGQDAPRLANTSCIALPGQAGGDAGHQARPRRRGGERRRGVLVGQGRRRAMCCRPWGLPPEIARAAIRVSLGPATTETDIAAFLAAWNKVAGSAALAA